MTSQQLRTSLDQAEIALARSFERTTKKIPAVSMRELVYGQPRPRLTSVPHEAVKRFRTVAEMKAQIDPVELERVRARLRHKGTKRIVKSAAKAVGSFLLLAGMVGGLGAGGVALARRELRK